MERIMGNPATDKRKATEKRRKKYEDRLGPGAYLPKEQREKLNVELEKLAVVEKARLEQAKKDRDARRIKKAAEKKSKPPAAAAAPAAEKPKA
jgi:predicted FMN-binding regulatory protein PaiB